MTNVSKGLARARLLILSGEAEPLTEEGMALAKRLAAHKNVGFEVSNYVFPEENHVSVIPASINRGLAFGLQCSKAK